MKKATAKKRMNHGLHVGRRAPMAESRRERFLRIAQSRVNRTLRDLRLIGNLSNANYQWEPREVEVMQQTIIEELGKQLRRFDAKRRPERTTFAFDTHAEHV